MNWWIIIILVIGSVCGLLLIIDFFDSRLLRTAFFILLTIYMILRPFTKERKIIEIPYYDRPYTRNPCPYEVRTSSKHGKNDQLRVSCNYFEDYLVACTFNCQLCMRAKEIQ